MNAQIHSVIGQPSYERFAKEKERRLGSPKDHEKRPQRFTRFREEPHKVASDCLIAIACEAISAFRKNNR